MPKKKVGVKTNKVNEDVLGEAFKTTLYEFFGPSREHGGSELLPPEWQTQLKKIVAGEIDTGERGRTFFDLAITQLLTHQANLNSAAVGAAHDGRYHANLQHTQADNGVGLWLDRIANPDEVAQLTETLRKGTPVQLDALATALATRVAEIINE